MAGEHCFVGSLQLSWQRALTNISFLPDSVFTLFGRFDAGSAKQGGALTAGEKRQQEAMSAAIGAQFVLDSGMTVNLEQATQLKNEPEPLKEEGITNKYLCEYAILIGGNLMSEIPPIFPMSQPTSSYDVVIIGGAIMGSSAAWFLSDNDDFTGRILVVEKDPRYAFCSTAHTNSCMRQQFSTELNINLPICR